MKPVRTVATAAAPDGGTISLVEHAGDWIVRAGRVTLMSSAAHHSEERMAELAFERMAPERVAKARVLVGGLGMGYTVRAVLDRVGEDAAVTVVELLAPVVEWNRGVLAALAGRPLDDPRVTTLTADVVDHLRRPPVRYDAILLDIDNGPDALTTGGNSRAYGSRGLRRAHDALTERGALVVWSGYDSPGFRDALERAGFATGVVRARARGRKGPRHTLFVARRG